MAAKMKTPSFESSLQRLEKIVEEMSASEMSLDNRLKRFEEGVALVRECKKELEGAAKKVEVLVKSTGGKMETRLFDEVREILREGGAGEYEADEKL